MIIYDIKMLIVILIMALLGDGFTQWSLQLGLPSRNMKDLSVPRYMKIHETSPPLHIRFLAISARISLQSSVDKIIPAQQLHTWSSVYKVNGTVSV